MSELENSRSEDDFFKLSNDSDIRTMTEFLMRSTSNLHCILQEPIFSISDIEDSVVERHYFDIVKELIETTKAEYISNFKDFVFKVIKKEHPVIEEDIFDIIDEYVHRMPLLFQISTEDLLNFWDMNYIEPNTGIEMKFSEWAALIRKNHE